MYTDASLSPEAHGLCGFESWCCTLCGFGQRNKDVYLPTMQFPKHPKHSCAPPIHPMPLLHNCCQAAMECMHMCTCLDVEARGPLHCHSSGVIHLFFFKQGLSLAWSLLIHPGGTWPSPVDLHVLLPHSNQALLCPDTPSWLPGYCTQDIVHTLFAK